MRHLALVSLALCAFASPAAAQTVYGLVGNDRIVTFDASNPGAITSNWLITGVGAGEVLTGIDIRPLDGLIYTVSTSGNVYRFTPGGGNYAATLTGVVTTFPFPGTPVAISGNNFGIDFAPADRIRLVSDLDQSLRINPLNGGAAVDALINNGAGGRPYDLIGVAYADNAATGAAFYGIDGVTSSLLRGGLFGAYVNTSLSGALFDPLGIGLNSQSPVGFDILFSGGVNSAFLSANDSFYGVDLTTGRATLIGGIGVGNIRGITTAVPEPASWAMMIGGFGLMGAALRRRKNYVFA